jgi:hypothetical protein
MQNLSNILSGIWRKLQFKNKDNIKTELKGSRTGVSELVLIGSVSGSSLYDTEVSGSTQVIYGTLQQVLHSQAWLWSVELDIWDFQHSAFRSIW